MDNWVYLTTPTEPVKEMPRVIPPIIRFLKKVKIDDKTGCWEWTAGTDTTGYSQLSLNSKSVSAHRFIYEYYHGTICPDLTIDHLCRTRACVNPLHLEQVTLRENILRGFNMAALNARKTHCTHGHEFNKENIQIRSDGGGRRCLTCEKLRHLRRYIPHPKKILLVETKT